MESESHQEYQRIREAFDRIKGDINILNKELILLRTQRNEDARKIKELEGKPQIKVQNSHLIIGNSNSKKVHYSNCPYAKKISSENKVKFTSLKDSLKEGYNRCTCIFNN